MTKRIINKLIALFSLIMIISFSALCLNACKNTSSDKNIKVEDLQIKYNNFIVNELEFSVNEKINVKELSLFSDGYSVLDGQWQIKDEDEIVELENEFIFNKIGDYVLIGNVKSEILVGSKQININVKEDRLFTVVVENGTYTANTVSENEKYEKGTKINITADVPNSSYNFIGWYDYNGNLVKEDAICEIVVEEDLYLIAKYEPKKYKVKVNNGTVSYLGETDSELEVAYGQKYSVLADTVVDNKVFVGWEIDNEIISSDNTYQLTLDEKNDVEVTAKYVNCIYNGYGTQYMDDLKIARDQENFYVLFKDSTEACDYSISSNRVLVLFDIRTTELNSNDLAPNDDSTFSCLSFNGEFAYSFINGEGNTKNIEVNNEKGKVFLRSNKRGGTIIIPYSTMTELSRNCNASNGEITYNTNLRICISSLGFFNNGNWADKNWKFNNSTETSRKNVSSWKLISSDSFAYTLNVENGTGSGIYADEQYVAIEPVLAPNETFLFWEKNGAYFSDIRQLQVKSDNSTYRAVKTKVQYDGYGFDQYQNMVLGRDENNFYIKYSPSAGNTYSTYRFLAVFSAENVNNLSYNVDTVASNKAVGVTFQFLENKTFRVIGNVVGADNKNTSSNYCSTWSTTSPIKGYIGTNAIYVVIPKAEVIKMFNTSFADSPIEWSGNEVLFMIRGQNASNYGASFWYPNNGSSIKGLSSVDYTKLNKYMVWTENEMTAIPT